MGQKEMGEQSTLPVVARHGADRLPSVEVDSYNVELKDNEGFIGDRASRGCVQLFGRSNSQISSQKQR